MINHNFYENKFSPKINFIEYIETSCADLKDNHMAYLYKKKILDEMTDRANEITHAGLKAATICRSVTQNHDGLCSNP